MFSQSKLRGNDQFLSFGECFIEKKGLWEHLTFSALGKFQENLWA